MNKPGGPQEGDFDVLKEFPDEHSAREYARSQVRKDFPGLILPPHQLPDEIRLGS